MEPTTMRVTTWRIRNAVNRTCPDCKTLDALRLLRYGPGHWEIFCSRECGFKRAYIFERVKGLAETTGE